MEDLKTQTPDDERQVAERKVGRSFSRGVQRKDPIFEEKITLQSEAGNKTAPLRCGNMDMTFLLIVLALLLYGVIMAYSASSVYSEQNVGESTYYIKRHLMFVMLALAATFPFIWKAKPWFWRFFGLCTYGGAVLLLIAVQFIGLSEGDAQRWIQVGPITIQPSEIAKTGVVMTLALLMTKFEKQIMSDHKFGGNFKYGVMVPGATLGLIVLLVAAERHISGVMIICMIGAMVMLLGGTRMRWIVLLGSAVVVMGVLLITFSSYADTRMNIWLRIEELDPLGEAWQTLQGLYAIGSGGLFGLGLGNSRQKFGYVSEPQNDFIFTIICEELGFFGAAAVLLLFGLLLWRGFKIAAAAPDKFCALTVYGLVFKTVLQALLNIAVVTNSMPNTGISLPFFSSGGTALAIQIFEMGIVLNISRFSHTDK